MSFSPAARNELRRYRPQSPALHAVKPIDHLLQQVAPDLRDTRGGVEIGEMSLRESR